MSQFLQQLLSKAKEKADALEQGPSRKKNRDSIDTRSVSDTPAVSDLVPVSDPPRVSDTGHVQSSHSLFSAYVTLQSKIHEHLPAMSPSELRLYLYLVDLAFGKSYPSDGVVEYNQREVMKSVGFGSHSTAVKVISSLTEKNLVTWICKASKRGEKSLLRVILPPDLPDHEPPSF
ncbi:hypothetical protein [Desulfomonile tiedjei]|uniref:Helix-turn-helix domain-containing protein n=1 Tax=Desulfomonile tiedjei (strain ATCC 49306 / DSM 6799 / DCB-1) TaxID=706587 RepID=I4CF91_DESTA|nr:hypothetical protein [Desulfomonile tiedjei]AFM28232.1 hypothetical protein Desti_5653 [Desulfomonile tiedjei DSM 6799]